MRLCLEVCELLGIDDPLVWMNATDPKVLDLWSAWLEYKGRRMSGLKPAEQAFSELGAKL